MPCPVAAAAEAQQVWTNKAQYVDAERKLHSKVSGFGFFQKEKKKEFPSFFSRLNQSINVQNLFRNQCSIQYDSIYN